MKIQLKDILDKFIDPMLFLNKIALSKRVLEESITDDIPNIENHSKEELCYRVLESIKDKIKDNLQVEEDDFVKSYVSRLVVLTEEEFHNIIQSTIDQVKKVYKIKE